MHPMQMLEKKVKEINTLTYLFYKQNEHFSSGSYAKDKTRRNIHNGMELCIPLKITVFLLMMG